MNTQENILGYEKLPRLLRSFAGSQYHCYACQLSIQRSGPDLYRSRRRISGETPLPMSPTL